MTRTITRHNFHQKLRAITHKIEVATNKLAYYDALFASPPVLRARTIQRSKLRELARDLVALTERPLG